ncbi:MAG: STAS domain-containing protein, partial [Eubacterium sp.]
ELSGAIQEVSALILDMEQVDYVSSAGIRALLSLHKKMLAKGGNLTLQKLNASVLSVLKMTKLDTIFQVE